MSADAQALREAVVQTCRDMSRLGVAKGTSGNVGVRHGEGFLISPTGIAYDQMRPEQVVQVFWDGSFDGETLPSSEWRFHRDILANRPDVSAVIHTHSAFATTLACLRKDVPPVHYMIAAAGGNTIRCTPYALFGEQTLSDYVLSALEGRKACLLANHGMIALGSDLTDALTVASEVEFLCELYWRALQAGEPHILTPQQMHDVQEKFVDYKKCT